MSLNPNAKVFVPQPQPVKQKKIFTFDNRPIPMEEQHIQQFHYPLHREEPQYFYNMYMNDMYMNYYFFNMY